MKTHETKETWGEVSAGTTLPGEVQPAGWMEPIVWTQRMREALARGGPEGGKWYSLHDKVFAERTLRAAYAQVAANDGAPGVDGKTVETFGAHLEEEIQRLRDAWQTGTYRPQAVRRTWIPKPGTDEKRPLGIPTVRDRVVQTALKMVLEPIFEVGFHENSYGSRPGRTAHDALQATVNAINAGKAVIVDADLKGYFDSIPHERLLSLVSRKISDGRILDLIGAMLKAGIMDQGEMSEPETGTPQGGVISSLLANLYLDELDHQMAQHGWTMIRYVDDFVVLCRNLTEAEQALEHVQTWTTRVGLTLHPTKTRLVDLNQEGEHIDFLGFRFQITTTATGERRILRGIRPKSLTRIKDAIRERTPRSSGQSLTEIIARLNPVLRGWSGYFRSAYGSIHDELDKMIRRRLRSTLLRFRGITRFGTGEANRHWPNAFFKGHGLYSLVEAHAPYIRAPRRAH